MALTLIKTGSTKQSGPARQRPPMGLGDMVEVVAKPIAKALKMDCLDQNEQLRPASPCWRRRAWLNAQGKKVGIGKTQTLKGTEI